MLGLKGLPRIAEDIVVSKNLELLGYAGGRLHFSRISSGKAVDLIRTAKKRLKVTCDITGYQPLFDDTYLSGFDTNFKVSPPLREKADNDALIKALKDGTIDVICSGHLPQDEESKNIEFDLADFGMINLQTFPSNLSTLAKSVDWEVLIEKVTRNPRLLLNLPVPKIEINEVANLTLFDPAKTWRLDEKTNLSKSKNSPWFGKDLKGKAIAVFNNGQYSIEQQA
jgi:dihydroorotase